MDNRPSRHPEEVDSRDVDSPENKGPTLDKEAGLTVPEYLS